MDKLKKDILKLPYKIIRDCSDQRQSVFDSYKKNQWISVKDKLPEEEKYVLVYYEEEKIKPSDIGYYSLTLNMWNVGYSKTKIVTHWMPLPEPPNE